jgi:hypothetical protein
VLAIGQRIARDDIKCQNLPQECAIRFEAIEPPKQQGDTAQGVAFQANSVMRRSRQSPPLIGCLTNSPADQMGRRILLTVSSLQQLSD